MRVCTLVATTKLWQWMGARILWQGGQKTRARPADPSRLGIAGALYWARACNAFGGEEPSCATQPWDDSRVAQDLLLISSPVFLGQYAVFFLDRSTKSEPIARKWGENELTAVWSERARCAHALHLHRGWNSIPYVSWKWTRILLLVFKKALCPFFRSWGLKSAYDTYDGHVRSAVGYNRSSRDTSQHG